MTICAPPEHSAAREAALDAMLPHVGQDGWTSRALRRGLAEAGLPTDDAALLFPGGRRDMIAAFCDLCDRRMVSAAADLSATRLSARVRAIIALRLAQTRPHRDAVGRAVGILALPTNAGLAAACLARTVDAIWHAAGDQAADVSWYTKRASLAAIWAATLLFWLRDDSEDDAATLAFLDRRLADLGRVGALRRRTASLAARLRPT